MTNKYLEKIARTSLESASAEDIARGIAIKLNKTYMKHPDDLTRLKIVARKSEFKLPASRIGMARWKYVGSNIAKNISEPTRRALQAVHL